MRLFLYALVLLITLGVLYLYRYHPAFLENPFKEEEHVVLRVRSDFATIKIERYAYGQDLRQPDRNGRYVRLLYGDTLHDLQFHDTDGEVIQLVLRPLQSAHPLDVLAHHGWSTRDMATSRFEPLSYYHRSSPLGQVFAALFAGTEARRRVAFLGLAGGTVTAHLSWGQPATVFEIDPLLVKVAREHFTFIRDCRGKLEIVVGEPRTTLAEDKQKYRLLVVNSVGTSLMGPRQVTREAVQLYFRKLEPDGVVAIHISHRHLSYAPVLANIAEEAGWAALQQYWSNEQIVGTNSSDWVLLARKKEHFGPLLRDVERWPGDQHRRWADLLNKPRTAGLTKEDLDQWKDSFLAKELSTEALSFKYQMEKDPPADLPARSKARLAEINREASDRNMKAMSAIIIDEEAQKKAKLEVEKRRKWLAGLSMAELRQRVDLEGDRQWRSQIELRKKVGVWTDEAHDEAPVRR